MFECSCPFCLFNIHLSASVFEVEVVRGSEVPLILTISEKITFCVSFEEFFWLGVAWGGAGFLSGLLFRLWTKFCMKLFARVLGDRSGLLRGISFMIFCWESPAGYGVDVSVFGSPLVVVLCGVCCSCRGMVGVMSVVSVLRGPGLRSPGLL